MDNGAEKLVKRIQDLLFVLVFKFPNHFNFINSQVCKYIIIDFMNESPLKLLNSEANLQDIEDLLNFSSN